MADHPEGRPRKDPVTRGLPSVNVIVINPVAAGDPAVAWPGGGPVEDVAIKFLDLIDELEDVSRTVTPQQALTEFDETTLQVFWKSWPNLSAWAGSLWSMLSAELAGPAGPQHDADAHETGGSG